MRHSPRPPSPRTSSVRPHRARTGVPIPSEPLQVSEDPALELGRLSPSEALATARRTTSGNARPSDPSATLALRELWLKRKHLRGAERRLADGLLARPSDGVSDRYGFGYTAPEAAPACNTRLCLHYVGTGTDAPPSPEWPAHNLAVVDSVWTSIVDQLGYRAPLSDRAKGGSPLFDVYLKDLGGDLYGFCAPEKRVKNRTASGFCVLDNDFSPLQFPSATPDQNLVVTAGHEFFHAVQFAYDYAEDPWMAESTATWMEERIATDVNDNRQYLPLSQIYAPLPAARLLQPHPAATSTATGCSGSTSPPSTASASSRRPGSRPARSRATAASTASRRSRRCSSARAASTKVYATYAAGNLTPAANFPEGAEYASPKLRGGKKLSKRKRSKRFGVRIDHLASRVLRLRPGQGPRRQEVEALARRHRTGQAHLAGGRRRRVYLANGKRQVKRVQAQPRWRRPDQGVASTTARCPRCPVTPGQRLDPLPVQQAHRARLRRQARWTTTRRFSVLAKAVKR